MATARRLGLRVLHLAPPLTLTTALPEALRVFPREYPAPRLSYPRPRRPGWAGPPTQLPSRLPPGQAWAAACSGATSGHRRRAGAATRCTWGCFCSRC